VSTIPAVFELLDDRTRRVLERREEVGRTGRRGWMVRRALLGADIIGLSVAYLVVEYLFVYRSHGTISKEGRDSVIFFVTLPLWVLVAKFYGLYERDEERTDHTTVEDMVDVFHVLTVGVWALFGITALTHAARPTPGKLFTFWLLSIALVAAGRIVARTYCRSHIDYLQNTIIVGAGDVGQLVARKLLQHHEYGINLVGFVDDSPKERRPDLDWLVLLGDLSELASLVHLLDVERVIFAFSGDPHESLVHAIRSLDNLNVQVDIVPRLFEIVSPTAEIHTIEALPVMSLRPIRLSRSSQAIKRAVDVAVAGIALVLLSPLFAVVALLVKRDSDGPVFFRQTRLGMNQRRFTALKFRTMKQNTSSREHEEYIKRSAANVVASESNGLFKLEREDVITRSGRWLRRTSLDELPQLVNVLRGDMSLVGPRPCLPYEIEYFEPHHFERFAVPAGITGFWQVMARAHATFREALDMDVAYVRGWSLGLDMRLIFRTPFQLLRSGGTR
jgi:exopolysaccharide biosynthesis polyprenyl glycosylphosphotransferase